MNAKYMTARSANYELLRENADRMRKQPTEAESILWQFVRGKKLGLRFYRQHVINEFIVDFVCLERNLIIEIDGKYHNTSDQLELDNRRDNILLQMGYKVLRFTNEDILCNIDNIIMIIKQELNNQ